MQAFADAGADVLFAPGLKTREEIETVVKAVSPRPVNVLMGLSGVSLSLQELEQIGVKRVSVGSSLVRAAYDAFFKASKEIADKGTFAYTNGTISYGQLNQLFNDHKK